MKARNSKPARFIAAALFALSALNFAGAVYRWFYSGFSWELGPIQVRLHQWDDAWTTGLVLWALAVIVRPGPWLSDRFVSLFDPLREKRAASPARGFSMMGAAPGFAIGYYLARLNVYLMPSLAHSVLAGLIAAAASAGLYYVWALIFARLPVFPFFSTKDEYRAGLRNGFHVFLWLLAVMLWGSDWEGRYFDPLGPLYVGILLGIVLAVAPWFPFKPKAHLTHKRVLVGTAALFAVLTAYGLFDYLYRTYGGEGPRDRVIFITLDTTRADRLSSYGYSRPTSPRIDALAASGVRFTRAVCPMDVTDASHASMFTGAYPRTTGVDSIYTPVTGPVSSLPEYLRERGFSTAAIVSRGRLLPTEDLNLPGFDYENGPSGRGLEATAPQTFRRAANWISQNRGRDVFIWVHFFDPHSPYIPHSAPYPNWSGARKQCKIDSWPKEPEKITSKKIEECRALYDEEIAYTDYWVGRLLDYVDQLEPRSERPPFIVIVADHGEALGEYIDTPSHFYFGHSGILYEAVLHIPLIMSWPGQIPAGTVVGDPAETVDLAPTLSNYLFGKDDFSSQGQNLRPAIEGSGRTDDLAVAQRVKLDHWPEGIQMGAWAYAVYHGSWKAIFVDGQPPELYNLEADKQEKDNQADSNPEKAAELKSLWDDWMSRTPFTEPRKRTMDKDSRDVLRDLGYVQ